MEPGAGRGWQERALAFVPPLLGALVFAVALLVLRRELAEFRLVDVAEHLRAIPVARMALAGALTVASYGLLTGYDALALRWIGRPLGPLRTLLASFLGFVFSHNVGVSFLGGGAVRYRLLSSWNVPAGEIARVIAFNIVTFWLGVLGLGGALLALRPLPIPSLLHAPFATSRPIGVALLAGLVLWLAASAVWRTPLRIRGFDVPIPRPGTTLAQLVLSAADWALAALCFWVLLPGGSGLSFGTFLAAYLLAQVIGLASHVPGGLGVLEGILVLLLAPWLPGDAILGSAVAYRIVYYLAPLVRSRPRLAG